MTGILEWIAGWILNWLLGKATTAVEKKVEEMARDKERGETNDKNVQSYEDAVSRADRIKAATQLLNRNRP